MRAAIFALASVALCRAAPAHAETVHEAVEAYALYQHDVSVLLDMEADGPHAINGALNRVLRHDPARVSRGFIAYGALVAAQSPAFATGVERHARAVGRPQLLALLRADTAYARNEAAGSAQAIQLILGSASADSGRAERAGERYHQLARTSDASWMRSSERGGARLVNARLTPEMRQRLRIGALEARPMNEADALGGRSFWDSLAGREAGGGRVRGAREQRGYADVSNRMLTVAALIVAGADDAERRRVSDLLDEPITNQCLAMERLQLRQCLSVTVDASERAYCLGRHGLSGPGSCFSAMVR